jgi:hypothetical protein
MLFYSAVTNLNFGLWQLHVFASFDIDAWTVLQNPARSMDVFGKFWHWLKAVELFAEGVGHMDKVR